MFTGLRIALLGAWILSSSEPPNITGQWSAEGWGTVVLNQRNAGEYSGGYTEFAGKTPGTIQLKWSPTERRFNGTWREGEDRFVVNSPSGWWATIFMRARTTDPGSQIKPAGPRLADLVWTRKTAKPELAARASQRRGAALPLDLTKTSYHTPASSSERISSFPSARGAADRKRSVICPWISAAIDVSLWGEGNFRQGRCKFS